MQIYRRLFNYLRTGIILVLFICISKDIEAKNHVYSYVKLNVRSVPSVSEESNILAVMNVGDSAQLISEKDDWYEVIYDDILGYIYKSYTGDSYISIPDIKTTFKENWMSYIISINTKDKLLATIEDWGFCGASDQSEMHLVIYNYSAGETLNDIFISYVSSDYSTYYSRDYQLVANSMWLSESFLIQSTLKKYNFKELYASNDSLIKKIDCRDRAYQVVVDSLTSDWFNHEWIGIEKIMHKNQVVWTSDEMSMTGKFPSSDFNCIMINDECLIFGVEYTNDYDCRFFHRVAIPITSNNRKDKLK